jgi:hypothetical protein
MKEIFTFFAVTASLIGSLLGAHLTTSTPLPLTASIIANVSTTSAPTVTISASPTTLTSLGQPTTLRWSSANTSSCTASGAWSGTKALSGSQSIVPTITGVTTPNVYTIVCSGIGSMSPHQAGNAVTVTVAPATPTTTQGNISSTQTAVIGSSFQNVFNQLGSWFKSL